MRSNTRNECMVDAVYSTIKNCTSIIEEVSFCLYRLSYVIFAIGYLSSVSRHSSTAQVSTIYHLPSGTLESLFALLHVDVETKFHLRDRTSLRQWNKVIRVHVLENRGKWIVMERRTYRLKASKLRIIRQARMKDKKLRNTFESCARDYSSHDIHKYFGIIVSCIRTFIGVCLISLYLCNCDLFNKETSFFDLDFKEIDDSIHPSVCDLHDRFWLYILASKRKVTK